MELEEALKRITQADMLISPDAVELLKKTENLEELANQLLAGADFVITPNTIKELLRKAEEKKIPMPVEIVRGTDFKPLAAE